MDNKNLDSIVKKAKSDNTLNLTLEEYCDEYLKLQEELKSKNQMLRDIKENDPRWAEYKELDKKAKELRGEVYNSPEFQEMKEEVALVRDKKKGAESIIVGLLVEKEIGSYEYGQGDFSIKKGFHFKKREEDPQNSKKIDEMSKKLN